MQNRQQNLNKATRNFWHPTYLGTAFRLLYFDGKECGKAVADRLLSIAWL